LSFVDAQNDTHPAQQAFEQQRPGLVEQGAEPVGAVELLEQE
jgi:hypothetical protein